MKQCFPVSRVVNSTNSQDIGELPRKLWMSSDRPDVSHGEYDAPLPKLLAGNLAYPVRVVVSLFGAALKALPPTTSAPGVDWNIGSHFWWVLYFEEDACYASCNMNLLNNRSIYARVGDQPLFVDCIHLYNCSVVRRNAYSDWAFRPSIRQR
jgi:hypothetical protein